MVAIAAVASFIFLRRVARLCSAINTGELRPLFLSNVTECISSGLGGGSLTRTCATKQPGINAKIIRHPSRYSAGTSAMRDLMVAFAFVPAFSRILFHSCPAARRSRATRQSAEFIFACTDRYAIAKHDFVVSLSLPRSLPAWVTITKSLSFFAPL